MLIAYNHDIIYTFIDNFLILFHYLYIRIFQMFYIKLKLSKYNRYKC